MTAAVQTQAPSSGSSTRRTGRWIDDWEPEDPAFWESTGKAVARRNLLLSILAEHLGFSVWVIWSIVAVNLNSVGFAFTQSQLFWLVAIPNLVGATLRLPYTFAVPRFGGRNWTVVSALLLIVPSVGLALAVGNPDTSFGTMLLVAALAGVGGGNFASSMTNISWFFPEKDKGWALGLNAAGGNIGVAVVHYGVHGKWASHSGFQSCLNGYHGTLSQHSESEIIERAKQIAKEHYTTAEALPFLVGDEHKDVGWKKIGVNYDGEIQIRLPNWHEGILSNRLEEYGIREKCSLNNYWVFETGTDIHDAKAILKAILAPGTRLIDERRLVKMIDAGAIDRGFIPGILMSQGSVQPSLF